MLFNDGTSQYQCPFVVIIAIAQLQPILLHVESDRYTQLFIITSLLCDYSLLDCIISRTMYFQY